MATTTVYPRSFGISITLTFRAGYLERVIDTATVYPRSFGISHHFDIQSTAWTLGYLERVVMDVYPRLFEISSR